MYEAPIVMAIYKLHGRIPISRTSKGNENWLQNSGVRNIGGIRNYRETKLVEYHEKSGFHFMIVFVTYVNKTFSASKTIDFEFCKIGRTETPRISG